MAPERVRRCRRIAVALGVALALGATAPASAQEAAADQVLHLAGRLLVSSGGGGHLADPVCRGGETLAPSPFAGHVSSLARARREGARTLALDTGGLLTPHGVARFAAGHDPAALATLVASLGYHALAFGEAELGAPRATLVPTLRALRARGVPSIASNLRCDDAARELCEALVDAGDGVPLFPLGEERVAVLAFLAPHVLAHVSRDSAAGVRLSPLPASVAGAVRAARRRGATLVVVTVDTGEGERAAAAVLSLASALPEDAKPDVLLGADMGARLLFARPPGFRPAVAASPPAGAAAIQVRRPPGGTDLDVLVTPLAPSPDPAPALRAFIDRVGDAYCAQWGEHLPGGALERPMDMDALLGLAAGVLREAAGAEIALLNRGVAEARFAPGDPSALTASDVFVALQYDDPIAVATVDGAWLDRAARQLPDGQLLAAGLTFDPEADEVQVHGRPLDVGGTYRVATLRFLAHGGDGLLPTGPTFALVDGLSLRQAVLDYLRRPRRRDPRDGLVDSAERLEWRVRAATDATFAGSRVNDRGAGYEDSQLARSDTATVGFESTFSAGAVSRLFGWDNTLQLRYQVTAAEGGGDGEGDDQIALRTTARYRGLRDLREAFYVPDPSLEAYVETEFTEPEERGFRHFLVRPTAGLTFTLLAHVSLRVAAGFEVQALDPRRDVLPGVGAVLALAPYRLLEDGDRRLELSSTVDYFVAGVGDENRQTLRGRLDTTLVLSDLLSLTLAIDLFGVRVGGGPLAFAADATAGLGVRWMGRRLSLE